MKLRGIDFRPAWLGSGASGFFGEGYWFHLPYEILFGSCFCPDEFTFVAKTTTLDPRLGTTPGKDGNMQLADDGVSPKHWFPDCIKAGVRGFLGGYMLNSVGLPGEGARWLLDQGKWQGLRSPSFLSFMSLKDGDAAIDEAVVFRDLLGAYLHGFCAAVGLQINVSCPNANQDLEAAARKATMLLDVFASLGVPLMVKLNALTPVEVACKIAEHPACDAILVSNTIPWGSEGTGIMWSRFFGTKGVSPLRKEYGGGGLSGAPLLPLVCDWIKAAKKAGITKPINAGGGILCAADVDRVKEAGADGISIATAVALRPWRLRSILDRAEKVFSTNSEGSE